MTRKSLMFFTLFALFVAVLLPRVSTLGSILTNDEPLWIGRAERFMEGIATRDPALTFTQVQPGVTTMWIVGLVSRYESVAVSQAAIAVATSALLLVAVGLLHRVAGTPIALLAGFFLALDNFLIAHSRVIHTDALMALFFLIALLFLALAWRTRLPRYLGFAGAATALAILSKLFAAFLVPVGIALSLLRFRRRARLRGTLLYLVPLLLLVVVLWPAVLVPHTFLSSATDILTTRAAETDVGKGGGDPFYYAREWFFRVSAITLPLAAAGLVGALAGSGRHRLLPRLPARRFWLCSLALVAAFGVVLTLGGQKGDRYFLIGVMLTDLFAAAGAWWVSVLAARFIPTLRPAVAMGAIGGVATLALAADTARIHPYELAHTNRLFPVALTQKLGWGEGIEKAAAWIAARHPDAPPQVSTQYAMVLERVYNGKATSLGHEYGERGSRYMLLYRSMFGRNLSGQETQYVRAYFRRGQCLHAVVINGLPYAWVFERLPEDAAPTSADAVRSSEDLLPLPTCDTTDHVS